LQSTDRRQSARIRANALNSTIVAWREAIRVLLFGLREEEAYTAQHSEAHWDMSRHLVDQSFVCEDCGRSFAFTIAEQAFYAERGFRAPGRCVECRGRRRAERNADLLTSYESLSNSTVWHETLPGYGGNRDRAFGQDQQRVSRTVRGGGYRAICAACGRDTELPFLPRGGRPVFCRECFNQRRGR
jgi:CxxC-x17-CxxC domain-containing protein